MNRLWVHFAIVITVLLLATIFLPMILGPVLVRAFGEPPQNPTFEAIRAALPPELQAQLTEQIQAAATRFLLQALVAAAVIGVIAGVVLSRMLSAPLQELAEGAEAVAGGDLSYRVPARGSDETRTVAVAFNQMAGELEEAETLRRQLLADVAHELRNPLHVLRGNLQAIRDGVYPLNLEEIYRLQNQTEHLTGLVDDLHELALAEARRLPLQREVVDLGELVKESAEIFLPLATADDISLRVELLGVPPAVDVDPARIRQAVQNLLGNALRHSPPGSHIRVTVTRDGDRGVVTVHDDGRGIAPEQLPKVFDRFFRTDDARDRESGGAGLGLAIVKAIVEAHDGTVTAASDGLGQGSTFTLTLPAR